eukprot:PhF_6_TR21316/c0_g1_i1/m.30732
MRILSIALLFLGVASVPAWAADLCPNGTLVGSLFVNDSNSFARSCTVVGTVNFGLSQTGTTSLTVDGGTVAGNSLLIINTTSAFRTTVLISNTAFGANAV